MGAMASAPARAAASDAFCISWRASIRRPVSIEMAPMPSTTRIRIGNRTMTCARWRCLGCGRLNIHRSWVDDRNRARQPRVAGLLAIVAHVAGEEGSQPRRQHLVLLDERERDGVARAEADGIAPARFQARA